MEEGCTTWRETFMEHEQRNEAKLIRVQERLKELHQEASRTRALKMPRLVRFPNASAPKEIPKRPSPRHYSPRPAAYKAGVSPRRAQLPGSKPLPCASSNLLSAEHVVEPALRVEPVPVLARTKSARRVCKAIEEALLPLSPMAVASTISVELEMAIAKVVQGEDYKKRVVEILAVLQDAQSVSW